MKRKDYMKPTMQVVKVKTLQILAGSGPLRKNDDYEEENDDSSGFTF